MDETPDGSSKQEPTNVLVEVVRLNKVASVQRRQVAETKLQEQEVARRLAGQYGPEMLLKLVHIARTSKDNKEVMKAVGMILDRWVGSPKPPTEEEKKGADGGSILDVLAAASTHNRNLEITIKHQALDKPEPKDIKNPDIVEDIEGFFVEVEQGKDNG